MVRSRDQIVYLNEQIRNKAANISVQLDTVQFTTRCKGGKPKSYTENSTDHFCVDKNVERRTL